MPPVFIGGLRNGGVNQGASNSFQSWITMPISHLNKQDIKNQIQRACFPDKDTNYTKHRLSPHFGGMV